MTIKNKMISVCLMFLVAFSVVGCLSKDTKKGNDFILTQNMKLIIAYVSISEDGEVISKRKISFINKAIEIIEDALDKK